MPYPHVERALDKLLDQCRRLRWPGKYYAFREGPFAAYYPGMDTFIPTMSLIYLVAILDDALGEYIQINGSGSAKDLCQRINLLAGLGLLKDSARLHAIRKRRNDCAHEPDEFIKWEEFDSCYEDTRRELSHLGIAAY